MKKYLVIVEAARQSYSTNSQLCGIFNTEDEAIEWVLNNPTIMVSDGRGDKFQFTIELRNFDLNLRKWVEIPQSELVALCSNCHSMVHRRKEAMDVDELKNIVQNKQNN